MSERRLDEAIDRTVREMMDVDPRPGLSRRVLARLDAPQPARPTIPRLAAAAAVLVVTAIAAALFVSRTPEPGQRQMSVGSDIRLFAPHAVVRSAPTRATPQTRRPGRLPSTVTEGVPPFVSTVNLAPLVDIVPIAVAPAGPHPLDTPEVIVAPLPPIQPVRVDPLSSMPR